LISLIRPLTRNTASSKNVRKLANALEAATSLSSILLHENKGLREAFKLEKGKRRRGRVLRTLI
jgi:hypothetical protein